jgi:hypothetical protein
LEKLEKLDAGRLRMPLIRADWFAGTICEHLRYLRENGRVRLSGAAN